MSRELEIHFIYDRLLRKYCALPERDRAAIRKGWQLGDPQCESLLIRSAPSPTARLFACHDLSLKFDLCGIAGFYAVQGADGYSYRWELNLRSGIARPYYNERKRICGLIVYRSVEDVSPLLLSSRKLLLGSKAVPYNPLHDHEIIHGNHIRRPRTPGQTRAGYGTRGEVRQAA